MPRITCMTCKRSAHATLSETGWESFPGGWLIRTSRGLAEAVCSMKCADERDKKVGPMPVPPPRGDRPSYCFAPEGGLCCTCHKTHSSMTCCAHDEPVVPR